MTLRCKDPRSVGTCADKSPKFYAERPVPPLVGDGYIDLTGEGVDKMRAAIDKGPISATIKVYRDFPFYWDRQERWPGDIYTASPSSKWIYSWIIAGRHAVEIVGYGTYYDNANAINYWLVVTTRSNLCFLKSPMPASVKRL